ncbi:hypothetical protein MHYP_G00220840 [Metynnis hypsauchen]
MSPLIHNTQQHRRQPHTCCAAPDNPGFGRSEACLDVSSVIPINDPLVQGLAQSEAPLCVHQNSQLQPLSHGSSLVSPQMPLDQHTDVVWQRDVVGSDLFPPAALTVCAPSRQHICTARTSALLLLLLHICRAASPRASLACKREENVNSVLRGEGKRELDTYGSLISMHEPRSRGTVLVSAVRFCLFVYCC